MLQMLKINLGIMTDVYDMRLQQYLDSALYQIETEGRKPDVTKISDMQLVVDYASWMWRRRDTGEGMPRMLRWQLNNFVFQDKMK